MKGLEPTRNVTNTLQHLTTNIEGLVSVSDYCRAFNEISRSGIEQASIPKNKQIRIALLSSFTIDSARIYLDVKCRQIGLFPTTYVTGFNQYNQEILDPTSNLYKFDTDIVFIAIEGESLMPEYYRLPFETARDEADSVIDSTVGKLKSLTESLVGNSNAIVVINNLSVPSFSPLGILDNKEYLGVAETYRGINYRLAKAFKSNNRVFVFDYDLISSVYGKERAVDDKMWFLAKKRLSEKFMLRLCDSYMTYVRALKGLAKKCVVLDLDNTLWGGIVGEDGFDGIELGPTPPGNVYVDLQKVVLCLFKKGIILAINSKNNPEAALEVIRKHPHMILREDNFAAIKINWRDKVTNMREIAKELNIGLDSLVFIDDSKVERDIMRRALPEVLTVEMPDDRSEYQKTLKDLNVFDTLTISTEDKRRGQMYVQRQQRKALQETAGNIEEFFYGLNIKVEIRVANKFSIPRITQLTQRTNQFNLTTKRLSEAEVTAMASSEEYVVYFLRVEDKFGDEGIVGAAFVRANKDIWIIDNFIMSCRVLGIGVEKCFASFIINEGRRKGIKQLHGRYIPTKKNSLAEDFYRDVGFDLVKKDNKGTSIWGYEIKDTAEYPKWIDVV